MNIYTIHSYSHSKLFDLFQKQLKKTGSWYRLIAKETEQFGDGNYPGTVDFWRLNIEYFLEICEKEKYPFLYLDCDVMVLRDPTAELEYVLGTRDFVAQFDKYFCKIKPMVCTGIMYINPTDNTKRMFEWMLKRIEHYGYDQKALNYYLLYSRKIKWGTLPRTYYSINFDNGNKVWDGKSDLQVKKRDYNMVHLNWTIGTNNKLKLWKEIERRIQNNSCLG